MDEPPARAHASLGASSAYRWMACPASVRLSADMPATESEYARQGTAAHAVGEWCLREGRMAEEAIGRSFGGIECDADMVEAVQVYLNYVRGITSGKVCRLDGADNLNAAPDLLVWIEKRFDLSPMARAQGIEADMFGTADLAIYHVTDRLLEVIDYKHGAGVPVEAKGNPQGRYYALGAVIALAGLVVSDVKITIVQPRSRHPDGPIRSDHVSAMDLVEWAADLFEAASRTLDPSAELVPGGHCRFCPAQAVCPGLATQALTAAQAAFRADGKTISVPPDPETLPVAKLAAILDSADMIEAFLSAVRAHAFGLLERGEAVPGFKLVEKRGTRQWVSEDMAEMLIEGHGIDPFEKKLLSPAKAEAALKEKGIPAKDAKKAIEHIVVSVSSGLTLAPEHDKRPAVTSSAVGAFPALA